MPHTCAFGCKATDVVMHVFPNPRLYLERFQLWVKLVGKFESLSVNDIYTKKRVCDIHFTIKDRNRYKRLNRLAVPSLHLPKEAEKLLNEHNNTSTSLHVDHNHFQNVDGAKKTDVNNFLDDGMEQIEWLEDELDEEPPVAPSQVPQGFTEREHKKSNEIQYFIDELIKEIQGDIDYNPLEDTEDLTGTLVDKLKTYNFSSNVILTNNLLVPYDKMEHLMYPEKAYAAITYCLLQQQNLFKESIHDFLKWASNAKINYESLKEKVENIFENGEFIKISLKILQLICNYRIKNVEMRKKSIADQALQSEVKESLKKIWHSSSHIFDEDILKCTLNASSINNVFESKNHIPKSKLKHDKGTQVNILPKKSDKVNPKQASNARKCVQVNINELDGIATGEKVTKEDAGSQTIEKDKQFSASIVLHNNPMQTTSKIMKDSLMSHCQKVECVVNMKRKVPHQVIILKRKKRNENLSSFANVQADAEHTDHPQPQAIPTDYNDQDTETEMPHNKNSCHEPKGESSITVLPEPSILDIFDVHNSVSFDGASHMNETESEQVYLTSPNKTVTQRRARHLNFGKKRQPMIPEMLNEKSSPSKSIGNLFSEADNLEILGSSITTFHDCDSPHLQGGCKHICDPQSESVSSSFPRGRSIHSANHGYSEGHDISETYNTMYDSDILRDPDFDVGAAVVVETQEHVMQEVSISRNFCD